MAYPDGYKGMGGLGQDPDHWFGIAAVGDIIRALAALIYRRVFPRMAQYKS